MSFKLKKSVLGIATILLLISCNAQATLTDGLVAYYKLDGTSGVVIDETGNNNGVNNGATRGVAGRIGNAFEFDGENSYVDTIPQTDIPVEMSVSMWIYPRGYGQMWGSVENPSGDKDGFSTSYNPEGDYIHFVYDLGNISRLDVSTPYNTVPVNTWSFLTFTIDGSNNIKIYIGSEEQIFDSISVEASGTLSVSPTSHDRALMIGCGKRLQSGTGFDGFIDDVHIYERALSSTEVTELYLTPEPATLLLLALGGFALRSKRRVK